MKARRCLRLIRPLKWKPFAAARGEADVEEYFQADLLDGDDDGGCPSESDTDGEDE
jgi:hypothetical protein